MYASVRVSCAGFVMGFWFWYNLATLLMAVYVAIWFIRLLFFRDIVKEAREFDQRGYLRKDLDQYRRIDSF